MAALSLFYSYSHEDEALRDQLEKHLRQLQRQGLISAWHDRKILVGDTWEHEIDTHLETASIILLLVSPDFLASDYCYDNQMQHALERHRRGEARVVPIILRQCDWQHSPLKDLHCLPRDGKPLTQWTDQDEAFHTITQSLRRVIEQQQAVAHPPAPLSPLDRQNRIRMLRQVRAIWIDGLLKQSLHQAVRIELHLQDRPDVLANPWRLQVQELDQAPQTLPDGTSIADVYDNADGKLLILGEPGSGKTTLLLELTRTLLERAEQDEQLPMPIVFHLSSWAEQSQSLDKWLVEELSTKYQVSRKTGQSWIDTNQVLPLLDGLDEVAKDARTSCVEEINDYYQSRLEHGSCPIVVCCRSAEYAVLPTRITFQHAVSILPLTDEQINTYLEQAGEQVRSLKQAVNEDTELHNLARQPLMLSIFMFAYQEARVSEVPIGTTSEEIRRTIFARYVEHMLKRRRQSKRWEPVQVIGWLMFLAKQMQQHNQTVFSAENLQSTWLSKKWKILYQWCIGLLFGLLGGMLFGTFFSDRVFGLVFGLVSVLVGGLNTWINPKGVLTRSWKEVRYVLIVTLVTELIGLSIILVGGWLIFGPVKLSFLIGGWGFSLVLGLISGLVFGLVGPVGMDRLGLELARKELPERLTFSRNDGVWRIVLTEFIGGMAFGCLFGLVLGLILMLPIGFLAWLFFELFLGPVAGLFYGLLAGLGFGLFFGILFGLLVGVEGFIKHFILRFLLWLRGDLPWNLVPFLDEAAERLLLRKVGGSYIFVHRLLLDYFAELEDHNTTS